MKLTPNIVKEYIQKPGMDGLFEAVQTAAAICYQTDVNKSKKSPKDFVKDVILKNAHSRALEFATVYLTFAPKYEDQPDELKFIESRVDVYRANPYSRVNTCFVDGVRKHFVTTNLRVIMQGNYPTDKEAAENSYAFDCYHDNFGCDFEYLSEPTEFHPIRRTFTMNISRGCADDFRTHITLSSMCESSRWCNFSKGKFGSQLTFIKPYWFGKNKHHDRLFKLGMWIEEKIYLFLANHLKLQAQQLKRVFPLGAKAELRLCGFDDAWQNFFWRRCDSHADPECVYVANMIKGLYYGTDKCEYVEE